MRIGKGEKGFTLIELAIVLVIIGIILGAVLKGQDLIEGAKIKKVIAIPNKWEVPIWVFYDKKGSFPGDVSPKNGLIDSFTALKGDLDTAKLAYPPDMEADVTIKIEKLANVCNSGAERNVMLITNVPLEYAKQFDRAHDGTEDGAKGRVQSCGVGGITAPSATWVQTPTDPVSVTYLFDKMY